MSKRLDAIETAIINLKEIIVATQAETAQLLRDMLAQLQKVAGEVAGVQGAVTTLTQTVADLEAIIAAGGATTQELADAVAAVKAQVQAVDDLIPDVIVPPPPAP